jgi:hypothetical protein
MLHAILETTHPHFNCKPLMVSVLTDKFPIVLDIESAKPETGLKIQSVNGKPWANIQHKPQDNSIIMQTRIRHRV